MPAPPEIQKLYSRPMFIVHYTAEEFRALKAKWGWVPPKRGGRRAKTAKAEKRAK